jgi:hypothetical protein
MGPASEVSGFRWGTYRSVTLPDRAARGCDQITGSELIQFCFNRTVPVLLIAAISRLQENTKGGVTGCRKKMKDALKAIKLDVEELEQRICSQRKRIAPCLVNGDVARLDS